MNNLLNYHQQGTGPDIILIHGLLGSLDNLNMVAKGLKDNFRVTNIDVRNHGKSFHQAGMSYSELAQDIVNLLEHLHIDSTHVLGHSMGGKIAMQLALEHSELVNKLIVADISPVTYKPHHNQILTGLKSLNFSQIKNRTEADKQLAAYVDDAGVRQFLLRNLSVVKNVTDNSPPLSFKCNLNNIIKGYPEIIKAFDSNLPADASSHSTTLFIKGGNSDYITAEHRPIIGKLFPNSKAKIIQGTGHWLHAEKTMVFNKIVNDFLKA